MKESDFLGKVYSDGEVIFKEGSEGQVMYIIQTGKVSITKQTSSGEVVVLNTIGKGDVLGEMSLFDRMPHSATASAVGDARILTVDKRKLFKLISGDPTAVFKIIQSMSSRIRKLSDELSEYKKTISRLS